MLGGQGGFLQGTCGGFHKGDSIPFGEHNREEAGLQEVGRRSLGDGEVALGEELLVQEWLWEPLGGVDALASCPSVLGRGLFLVEVEWPGGEPPLVLLLHATPMGWPWSQSPLLQATPMGWP
jgi:hypothetical protein